MRAKRRHFCPKNQSKFDSKECKKKLADVDSTELKTPPFIGRVYDSNHRTRGVSEKKEFFKGNTYPMCSNCLLTKETS